MIKAISKATPYQVEFSNGQHSALADTTNDKGGGQAGFRPHELLEAALAACMNMTARMYAAKHNIPLEKVVTKISLDRSAEDSVVYNTIVELTGDLTNEQRQAILASARACPVRKTLLKSVKFQD